MRSLAGAAMAYMAALQPQEAEEMSMVKFHTGVGQAGEEEVGCGGKRVAL